MLMLNICLLYSQNFGNFSNIEKLFNLTKQEVEKEIKNNGYQFKDKDKLGITTYIKKVPGYTFAVNLLFGGTQLKMIGWDDTVRGGAFIVNDVGYDLSYKMDETKTDDYLGVYTSVSNEKGFQILIGKTIPNLNKGMISFTLTKIDNKKINIQKSVTSKIVNENKIINEDIQSFENDDEIVKSISKEDLKRTFLPKKLTNSKQLFSVSNFKNRMINLAGNINYDFIENICVDEIKITDDSNYIIVRGFREKGFNTKNKDNYIIAIDPSTQVLFVGIRKDNKIVLYGEEKVFPDEIYQWKIIEENIK